MFFKKAKEFFFRIFFCIVLNWFLAKNYFNLAKIFVLRLFKMKVTQTKSSMQEQSSLSKFLVAEKC